MSTCKDCKFYFEDEKQYGCRRYPPTVIATFLINPHAMSYKYEPTTDLVWPFVSLDHWCGEFVAAPDKDQPLKDVQQMMIKLTFKITGFFQGAVNVLHFMDIRDESGNVIDVGEWCADGDFEQLTLNVTDEPNQPTLWPIDAPQPTEKESE